MEIQLKNHELDALFSAVDKVKFTSMRLNRFKHKFMKRLIEKESEYQSDVKAIYSAYIQTDDTGEWVKDANGTLVLKDGMAEADFVTEVTVLNQEMIRIDFGEHECVFKELFGEIANSSPASELSFKEMSVLDAVLDQVESEGVDHVIQAN